MQPWCKGVNLQFSKPEFLICDATACKKAYWSTTTSSSFGCRPRLFCAAHMWCQLCSSLLCCAVLHSGQLYRTLSIEHHVAVISTAHRSSCCSCINCALLHAVEFTHAQRRYTGPHAIWSSTGWTSEPTSIRHMPCKEEPQICTCPSLSRCLPLCKYDLGSPGHACNDHHDLTQLHLLCLSVHPATH